MRIVLNGGAAEPNTQIPSGAGAAPKAWHTTSDASESVGALTRRAYGFDSRDARARIEQANTSLNGEVRIPIL